MPKLIEDGIMQKHNGINIRRNFPCTIMFDNIYKECICDWAQVDLETGSINGLARLFFTEGYPGIVEGEFEQNKAHGFTRIINPYRCYIKMHSHGNKQGLIKTIQAVLVE